MGGNWTLRVASRAPGAGDRLGAYESAFESALETALAAAADPGAPPRVQVAGNGLVEFRARFDGPPELHEHDPAWLARLLCDAAAAVDADRGVITTDALDRAVVATLGARHRVGALSLAPDGVLADALPASVMTLPCGAAYAAGRVIAIDLRQCAADPHAAVDALIAVDSALAARAASRA